MKPSILLFLLGCLPLLFPQTSLGQGCVAIRHFSSCGGTVGAQSQIRAGAWQVGGNYRYFKSYRHFRGTHEEPDRVANGSEVINHSHAWDFFVAYGINDRVTLSATLPFVLNTRSSLYEHGRNNRHTTFSRGIADMRIGANLWLLVPSEHPGGNLSLGAGIKLPTGDYQATDLFYHVGVEGRPEVRPVDQSIQPGDGGFGITVDLQAFQQLGPNLSLYGSGFYLINPRETNGVRTFRETLSPILTNEAIMAVPDQYSVRAGLSYAAGLSGWHLTLGGRFEGVPVRDLLGGDEGFRRPGNVLSIEPGFSYLAGLWSVMLSVPVAVRRNRPQSVTDLETEQVTGNPRNGDAAFADYLISLGIQFQIPGRGRPLENPFESNRN